MALILRQFFCYGIVGTIGFVVDASILVFLVHKIGMHPLIARIFSFSVGNIITFLGNRWLTFKGFTSKNWLKEWGRYLLLSALGITVNYGVYSICILSHHFLFALPLVAVTLASICAMVVNFFFAKYWVFIQRAIS